MRDLDTLRAALVCIRDRTVSPTDETIKAILIGKIERLDEPGDVKRSLIASVLELPAGSAVAPGAFVRLGDAKGAGAGWTRLKDDLRRGRLHWRTTGQRARFGLDALDRGETELARLLLREAETNLQAAAVAHLTQAEGDPISFSP